MKPNTSQIILQQALREFPSQILEISTNGYHVRRIPLSYPPKFLPPNSSEVVDDDGLAFWDQRTIHVEPHLRSMCLSPAKIAYWLKEHGRLRPKWLPIQAVDASWSNGALVVLSGSVMHDDIWQKWTEANRLDGWTVTTKVEHTMRAAKDLSLPKKQSSRGIHQTKINDDDDNPTTVRPLPLPVDTAIVPTDSEAAARPKKKRKRRTKKSTKPGPSTDYAETNTSNDAAEDEEDHPPKRKRRA